MKKRKLREFGVFRFGAPEWRFLEPVFDRSDFSLSVLGREGAWRPGLTTTRNLQNFRHPDRVIDPKFISIERLTEAPVIQTEQ